MDDVRSTFSVVYSSRGSNKPHCPEYRELSQNWGFQANVFAMANKEPEKIAKIKQDYLTDTLTLLTYLIQEAEAEEKEQKFQQTIKDAKRGR